MLLSVKKFIQAIIFLIIIQNLLFAITEDSAKKVMLNTREYENYRRFIIEIPEEATNQTTTFVRPQISTKPDSGIFSIVIKSENVQKFEGERLRKSEGDIPVRFIITYPDSNTIKIDGKSNEFDEITSFYLVDKNKYIFDLYKFSNDDNFYSNSVKLLTPVETDEKVQDTVKKKVFTGSKNNKFVNKKSSEKNDILSQSIKTAGMILSGVIFLVLATYFILKIYTGKNLFQDIKQISHPTPKETKKHTVSKKKTEETKKLSEKVIDAIEKEEYYPPKPTIENPIVDESAINSMLFDKKERQVRKIMHQKNLNYNEAELLFNLSHGQLNG